MQRYVGFYWTLPVPFANFTSLPQDVDAAAGQSRTIRYQRDRVRRWVAGEKAALVAERVFLELQPDRGTDLVRPALDEAIALCTDQGADLVLVDFAAAFGWRRHSWLRDHLEASGIGVQALDPAPIPIDGATFDPVEHFRTWQQAQAAFVARKPERKAALIAAIGRLPVEDMTLAEVAAHLNAEGLRTPTGKPWTRENVRKFLAGA